MRPRVAVGAIFLCALVVGMDGGVAAAPGPVDVAAEVGLGDISARTWTANAADVVGDDNPEWLLVRHNPQWFWTGSGEPPVATLFKNQLNGTEREFVGTNFAASRASEMDRHDCDFDDVDRDADQREDDLFCAIGLDDDSTNELRTQETSGGFVDSSADFGLSNAGGGNYRTTTFINANADTYPDIYVTRYYGPDGAPLNDPAEEPPAPNELWINQNGTSFVRAPDSYGLNTPIGAQKDTPGCTQAVDFDNDNDDDLLVCAYKSVKLYRNNGDSTFSDVTTAFAVGGFWKDAAIHDLGGTMRKDIVQLKAGSLVVKLWNGTKWAKRYSNALSAGETLATGDIDGDDDQDIYVVRTCASGVNQPDLVYLNDGTGEGFAKLTLPSAVAGCGNDVERIDYDEDGSDEFIVLNGKQKKPGPVQLFTWR